MDLSIVTKIGKQAGDFMMKNSPTILAGLAVGGVFTTGVMGIKAGSKAERLLWDAADQKYKDWVSTTGEDRSSFPLERIFTAKEIVQLTWKCYVPTAAMGLATIFCIIGGHSIAMRRNAALAGLYSLAEKTMQEYQAKIIETLGEKKEEKVRDAILQDQLNKNPVNNCNVIVTGKGESLCFDRFSGQYFMSDIETIRRVINDFNENIVNDRWGTVSELYHDLGLQHMDLGEKMGWTMEYGILKVDFTSMIASDGRPCLVLVYNIAPRNL